MRTNRWRAVQALADCSLLLLLAAMATVLPATRSIAAGPDTNAPRVCRFSAAPVDPRCLDRSGATDIVGVRVSEANGYRFPDHLRVYALDLRTLPDSGRFAVTSRSPYPGSGISTFELFQGEHRFRPARWPEKGFVRTIAPGPGDGKNSIILPPDLFGRFGHEPFLWFGGYPTAEYAFETSAVQSVDPASRVLTLNPFKGPQAVKKEFASYLFNAFSALSQPGDYVFDKGKRIVYAAATEDSDRFGIATSATLLEIVGAENLRIEGLKLEKVLGAALVIRDSRNITIDNCLIRHSGKNAIVVQGGSNVVISNCRIYDIAETAIDINGGDRITLTPSGHAIVGNDIRTFGADARSYRPAIRMGGVGIRVEDNYIADAPHSAIILQGNDHLIRGNRIHNVGQETNDVGAIYFGRDWTERGTVIDSNWFSEIGMPDGPGAKDAVARSLVFGIYLDDQESGYRISRNVFDRVNVPVMLHGGRDNIVEGNAFLRCRTAGIRYRSRGEGLTGGTLQQRLEAMPYRSGIWAERYPALAGIENARPADPINNSESGNFAIDCPLYNVDKNINPAHWPDIGKNSRQSPERKITGGTTEVLEKAGMGCDRLPVLCQWRGRDGN